LNANQIKISDKIRTGSAKDLVILKLLNKKVKFMYYWDKFGIV